MNSLQKGVLTRKEGEKLLCDHSLHMMGHSEPGQVLLSLGPVVVVQDQ